MKKHLFYALAALGMVACMQDEVVTVQQDAISFNGAFVENATRAAADPSPTVTSIADFNVWGFMDQPSGEVFKGEEDMLIWVSDDNNRLPVFFEAPLLVGTATGRMTGYEGLKHPFEALVEKKRK